MTKVHKVNLFDYNRLEFLGDKLIDFFVLDFYFRNSANYKQHYGSKVLHKLKSEIVNNDFLSVVSIENSFHEFLLYEESSILKDVLKPYISDIKLEIEGKGTRQIFENFINNNPEIKRDFMNPEIMRDLANNPLIDRIDLQIFHGLNHKVLADTFEALIGAIFLDSGGNFERTREVFMRIMEPYLYVYGNIYT